VNHYCVFVEQLLSTADEVAKLQEELELMKPMLAEAVQESVVTMQRISEDTVCRVTTNGNSAFCISAFVYKNTKFTSFCEMPV